jgi:hypothetical protein
MEVFDCVPGLPELLMLGSGPEALSVAADDLCQSRLLIPTDRISGLQCASLTNSLAKFVDIALAFSKSCSSSL